MSLEVERQTQWQTGDQTIETALETALGRARSRERVRRWSDGIAPCLCHEGTVRDGRGRLVVCPECDGSRMVIV